MNTCISYKHPDVIKLAGELNLHPAIIASKIGVWQEKNNITDRFPTKEELLKSQEINLNNIKPGVSELFESNQDLANAVYEALGFKSKPNVILPIGTSGSGKSTFIKSLPQENLVVIEPDAMRVEFTGDINDKSKDKEIYIEAANRAIQAIRQGKQVVFDTTNLTKDKRLPFIEAIKKAIPTANIQYKLMELNPELAKQRIKADIAAGKNRANVPDSTIDRHAESYKQMLEDIKSEPISNYEITPQQKQQALQLYSQYLDTIFPDSKVRDIVYHGTNKKFDKFEKGKGFTSDAFWFEYSKSSNYGKQIISAIVNIKNTYNRYGGSKAIYIDSKYGEGTYFSIKNYLYYDGTKPNIPENVIDEIRYDDMESHPDEEGSQFIKEETIKEYQKHGNFDSINGQGYLGVFEPEQIHILGSKQDVEGFKSFIKSNKNNIKNDSFILFNKIENLLDNSINKEIFNIEEKQEIKKDFDFTNTNKNILFNNEEKLSYNVDEILNNILKTLNSNISLSLNTLLEKSSKILNKTNAKVEVINRKDVENKFSNYDKDSIMVYDSNINKIYIIEDSLKQLNSEQLIQSFLHEIAHALTEKALKNPETFEEKEFSKLIKEQFEKYKIVNKQFKNNQMYGFTNESEFVAELFTNSAFQDEIKNTEKSFWQEFKEALRRLFNLIKNKNNLELMDSLLLIEKVNNFINNSNYKNFEGFQNKDGIKFDANFNIKERKSAINEQKGYNLETINKRIDFVLNKAKDNLDQSIAYYKKVSKTAEKEVKTAEKSGDIIAINKAKKQLDTWNKFLDNFKDLLKNLEEVEEGEELKAISNYLLNLEDSIIKLNYSFNNKDFTEDEIVKVINNYNKYLSSFSIYKDISSLLADIKTNNKFHDKIDFDSIDLALNNVSGIYNTLYTQYNAYLKEALKKKLSNLNYLPELEKKWINLLTKEYNEIQRSLSKDEWISDAMNNTYKEDIQLDIEDTVNSILNNPSFDIQWSTRMMSAAINTNSDFVQIINKMLTEMKEKINSQLHEKEFELSLLFDKLSKEKNSTNPIELYKNLINLSKNGKYYLTGEFNLEFKENLDKLNSEIKELFNDGKNKLAKSKIEERNLLFKNSNKYKNSKKLSLVEKEVLEKLKEIQDISNKSTYRFKSKINWYGNKNKSGNIEFETKFYELPSINKTDVERLLSNDIKGTIKDKWTDLTKLKSDDIDFNYATDNEYNILHKIPVRYRGNIDSKDQSLDLFSVYRLEYLNGINYKVKSEYENDLNVLLEISKNKTYYRTQGTREVLNSIYNKRNKESIIQGESNEYKMIKSLIETNIYDIGHHYAGKIGEVDLNKAIKTVNSLSANIGLNLNYFAATANVLNAKAQTLLETISKQVINKENIKKAEYIYTKNLPGIMSDLGKPVEKSFVNQVNKMFDVFGMSPQHLQEFVKSGILKSYANLSSLQFMHKTGEHWVQSVLTMSILDSVKVMNSNNKFIDKAGNEVSENKAASLLDMLYLDENTGILKISDKVVYTTKSLTTKLNEGGKENITLLIEKKIKDCFGNYNHTTQPEAKRYALGKLLLMFKGFFWEMATKRYRGFSHSIKSKDEIESDTKKYKHFNYALKEYEEGTYTSFIRYFMNGVIPTLKKLQFNILSEEWNKLDEYEKQNIKHSLSEVITTMIILPLIAMFLAGGDDDKDKPYFVLYQIRRLTSELAGFRNPSENVKLLRSPIASSNLIEHSLDAIFTTMNPWMWDEEIKSGRHKGDLKIKRKWEKIIPIINQFDKDSKELYNYQNMFLGGNF